MKQLLILSFCFIIISCNQQVNKEMDRVRQTATINVDSLHAVFLAGWNNKDSAAIMKTIAEHAVLMNDSILHKGSNAIANNWVSGENVTRLPDVKYMQINSDNKHTAYS